MQSINLKITRMQIKFKEFCKEICLSFTNFHSVLCKIIFMEKLFSPKNNIARTEHGHSNPCWLRSTFIAYTAVPET